ncbi:MAG: peptidylprolyl isomerase [Acetobacteraceae bacterium]|nr:peptidylprolyl isomerase [Acetobacteraceae bacterium]
MTRSVRLAVSALALLAAAAPALATAAPMARLAPAAARPVRILAVVNGTAITSEDVDNRARLFAVSSSLPQQPEVLERLRPQILRQLVDERLRMQEVERQHIVVEGKQIAAAIQEIEGRNGMQPGALRAKLSGDGVSFTTLIDQVRTEIGWTMLLRQQMGDRLRVSDADVAERTRALTAEVGQPEYHVSEIFIPVENPARDAEARRFADVVIKQLRAGAPFPVVAAQFSQSQSALQGGDLGWVQSSQLDPSVAKVVQEMPPGAVSEPLAVPGGLAIAHLIAKRQIGRDIATMLSMRQVFLPFATPLNPSAPTPQQTETLKKAEALAGRVHGCAEMEQAARDNKSPRPADPGDVRLDAVNPPPFRAMLASLAIGRASRPLISTDGIAVMMVCSREEKNLNEITRKQVQEQILETRVELLSRQLQQDLRRQARIELRGEGKATASST